MKRTISGVVVAAAAAIWLLAPAPRGASVAAARQDGPAPKRVLAIGDTQTGFTHDSISHALAVVDLIGRESGLWDTFIRTDSQWITKAPVPAPARNARTLDDFDAVFLFVSGEGTLSSEQKQALLSFVAEDGKGAVAAHSGIAAFYEWPEYGEMFGGYFDNHPWDVVEARVRVEAPDHPAMRHFPATFIRPEEYYVLRAEPYSRDDVDVLASIDPESVDLTDPDLRRTDRDFPVAMSKTYGQGRTFWSTFGHDADTWDDPAVRTMYFEALRWVMKLP